MPVIVGGRAVSQGHLALSRFVLERSGVALDPSKSGRAADRLVSLARHPEFGSLAVLIEKLEGGNFPALEQAVIEAVLTSETSFFRDRTSFDYFQNVVLPRLLISRAKTRQLRFWCAACSTGQESYSLAMILEENFRDLVGWHVEILATDISTAALECARKGRYSQFDVQRGLPVALLLRHFRREGGRWQISDNLRSRIVYKSFNLLADYQPLGVFDGVFCRNVLMYFNAGKRREVLDRMARTIAPDGVLVLGSSETVVGITDGFAPDPDHADFNIPVSVRPRLRLVASR
jgi:chemotaxis protein methyltransferase CheR